MVLASAERGTFPQRPELLTADPQDDEALAQAKSAGTVAAYEAYLR